MFHVFSPYVPIISRIPEAASSEASAAAPTSQHLVHRRGKAHGGRLWSVRDGQDGRDFFGEHQ